MITIDQVIAEKLNGLYLGEWPIGNFILCVIAILLSAVLCGAVGIEREKRGRSAGLRTHLLVGVGSCVIMIISIYGFPFIVQEVDGVKTVFTRDTARLAAQVVTGVGFLGAGAIIHKNSGIRGLTTAATIWIVMAIGLACGSMNFILAIGSTLLIMFILTVFKKFEAKINKKNPLMIIRADANTPIAGKVTDAANSLNCQVDDLRIDLVEPGEIEVTFLVIAKGEETPIADLIGILEKVDGVKSVGTLNSTHKM